MTDINPQDNNYFSVPHAEVTIDDDLWHQIDRLDEIVENIVGKAVFPDEEISLLLTNDDHIQGLNKDFRDKDKPTNVLSFPSDEEVFIGDIAISFNTLEKEAEEQDKNFIHHFIHMLVHGILHLRGYDHENEEDADKMESLEIKILEDMGIKNPYI